MAKTSESKDDSETNITVNALLASMQNAILDAKQTPEIITAFTRFYDEDAIKEAFDVLGLKRSNRNRDRKVDLENLLNHLRNEDWKAKHVQFAATDFKKVCIVPSGIGDELQFRYQLMELQTKFSDMVACFDEVKQLALNAQNSCESVRKFLETPKETVPTKTFAQVAKKPKQKASKPSERSPPTPPPSQVMAIEKERKEGKNSSHSLIENGPLETEQSKKEGWVKVTARKRKTETKVILGTSSECGIKAVPKPNRTKTGFILISRCSPETTSDQVKNEIGKLQSSTGYRLISVDPWRSKYETYSSFKVSYELGDKSLNQFLDELIYNDSVNILWPAGVLVKSFRPILVKKQPSNL